ncbi:tRNA uridine-5-carboxymethylaminomethyl(34) synthesis GTPase MnmE [Novilysobacter defluvii]|nr:tRNA uridine-5-carboxymethylaminomethyl(34) synthesis GTPase MnmE [Lysobacter defluvii]
MADRDTIAAIATAPGSGGVGIIRLSGPDARRVGESITGRPLRPRHAHHATFRGGQGEVLDDGIALYFAAPASYTGEDVVELQGHGGRAVLQSVLSRCLELGARMARPGEFSERAFLEGRLDLAQAEAVADLIAAGDARAARAARRALDGEFSTRVESIAQGLLEVRVHVEAAIDFADEPLDTLGGGPLRSRMEELDRGLAALLAAAERGRRLRDGLHAVIVGPPNAGKSSLLNALAGRERAIVTDVAGTTRDLLQEQVHVEGVELTLVDTAGLREGGDEIEREGMRRARGELARADLALVVLDARDPESGIAAVVDSIEGVPATLVVHNKADLLPRRPVDAAADGPVLVSARSGEGLDTLRAALARAVTGTEGVAAEAAGGEFTARARHVEALREAASELGQARQWLASEQLELAAEALRLAHDALGAITGRVDADTLLGHIFSTFCVGK